MIQMKIIKQITKGRSRNLVLNQIRVRVPKDADVDYDFPKRNMLQTKPQGLQYAKMLYGKEDKNK